MRKFEMIKLVRGKGYSGVRGFWAEYGLLNGLFCSKCNWL